MKRTSSYAKDAVLNEVCGLTAFLLTGSPGIGKTTALKKVAASLPNLRLAGFYTEEIRTGGVRRGFELVPFRGKRLIMAQVDSRSNFRVGKYGVDLEAIITAVEMNLAESIEADLFLIDEIGKMECLSALFVQKVSSLLATGKPVVASVALKGAGFIAEVKKLPGVALREITVQNRNKIPDEIVLWVKGQGLRAR